MEEALKQSNMHFAAGEIVKGTIIEVRPKEVLVDIGYKSEGVIPGSEFDDIKAVKVGDEIDVLIEKLEDKDGMVVLSREKAEFKKNWERILTICNEGGTITGKVKAVVKGGLLVNIGVEAFLPASQIDVITPKNLQQYVGNAYEFKVVKINQERQNIVLSRRELIEQERTERRQKLLTEMTPGDIRKGTVKNITDFGAFIDLNGIDGLLHITDMSWGRIGHPSEMLKVGQDHGRRRSRHQPGKGTRQPRPQAEAGQSVGQHRNRSSRSAPRSTARWSTSCPTARSWNSNPASKVWSTSPNCPGPSASPSPPTCSSRARKSTPWCSASTARSRKSPSASASSKPIRGTRPRRNIRPARSVKGKVRNLTSYGAFIELEEGIDGMIHVSDMSWTRKINHPSEV